MNILEVLKNSNFGRRTAEEENDSIQSYFVQTEQWRRVFSGKIDVVYGPKGSGKSAIYSLILKNRDQLFDNKIIAIAGEHPQGAPAFKSIKDDAPGSESEFVNLWKMYILTLVGQAIKEYGISNSEAKVLTDALENAKLLPSSFSLSKALKYAFDYIKKFRPNVSEMEAGIAFDPVTNSAGINGKIVFSEPSAERAAHGEISVDELFSVANEALKKSGYSIWVLLDRLDVAFSDDIEIETMALRALFKFYLDTKQMEMIRTKIFLRTDIWENLAENGFREASHIERSLTIQWNEDDLHFLVVRRILHNKPICELYGFNQDNLLNSKELQKDFWNKVFPAQVDSGPNKPTTFNWMLSRTRDATQNSAPRELIHLMNELRDQQINRLERGEKGPSENRLFEQVAFKEALPEVSRVRLHQTLFAEFPSQKQIIEKLKDQKATQTKETLAEIWGLDQNSAAIKASELEKIGFFERFGQSWRVPFIYRPALNLVQGTAD